LNLQVKLSQRDRQLQIIALPRARPCHGPDYFTGCLAALAAQQAAMIIMA